MGGVRGQRGIGATGEAAVALRVEVGVEGREGTHEEGQRDQQVRAVLGQQSKAIITLQAL